MQDNGPSLTDDGDVYSDAHRTTLTVQPDTQARRWRTHDNLVAQAKRSVEAGFWLFAEEGDALAAELDIAIDALKHAVDDADVALREARERLA